MHLTELLIRDFRCFEAASLEPKPGINLIVGDNTSGKTSILESIYFLGRAQSFRHTGSDALIREGQSELTVFGRVKYESDSFSTFGIRRRRHETLWKIDGNSNNTLLELVKRLPIQVIDPNLHQLLEDGPAYRRRYLDWGVFHVEQDFFPAWQRLQRSLRQRNRALKAASNLAMVKAWDHDLITSALRVDEVRRRYLSTLVGVVTAFMQRVLPDVSIEVQYYPGWSKDKDYAAMLESNLARDRELGYTQAGPHRADLRVKINGDSVRQRASRGQQKLITMILLLAQAELIRQRRNTAPIVLIDDLAAELGPGYREALFNLILTLEAQCFITFLSVHDVPEDAPRAAMFHVEHGHLSLMI